MGLVLKSDYRDYYDDAFEKDLWGTENTKFIRNKDWRGKWDRLKILNELNPKEAVVKYGYPEGMLFNDELPGTAQVEVYTNIFKDVKEVMTLEDAAEKHPNCLCVEVLEEDCEDVSFYRVLSIGYLYVWLIYMKSGEIKIVKGIKETPVEEIAPEDIHYYLLSAMDYKVVKNKMIAFDFTYNPILSEVAGLPDLLPATEVITALEKAICQKSMQSKS